MPRGPYNLNIFLSQRETSSVEEKLKLFLNERKETSVFLDYFQYNIYFENCILKMFLMFHTHSFQACDGAD